LFSDLVMIRSMDRERFLDPLRTPLCHHHSPCRTYYKAILWNIPVGTANRGIYPKSNLHTTPLLGFVPGGGRAGSGTKGFLSVSMTVAESVGTRLRGEIGGLRRDGSRGGSVGDRTEPS
jgi:hypothetical protein